MAFELELLERKAKFQEELEKSKQGEDNEHSKPTSGAKLPKLPITKFNGKTEAWLPFWGKFKSEIDSTDIPILTKFSYLKELLDEKVRPDIDGLPFTEAGYAKAKEVLESEYGQMADVVNTYIVNIMSLPVINGKDPAKINEFYKQLRYNVQSLDTLHRLADVKGNVRATLDKLKGIKADLVHGKEDWQNWEYKDLLKALKTWREINPVEEKSEHQQGGGKGKGQSRFYHANDGEQKSWRAQCIYCGESTHKGTSCSKVKTREERKKILARKGLCFNCTGAQHRANDCKSKLGCQKCQRRHHTSICDQTEQFLGASSSTSVIHPVVVVQVGGFKCRALLDTGAGSSYISAALLDQIPKRCCKKEVRKIDMMLGTTTREVELSTIEIAGLTSAFSLSVEVTKVDKKELLTLDNPRYAEIIKNYTHMRGVTMEDHDRKDKLPVHIILGASEIAKLKTERPPRVGLPGQPVAELTQFGWTIMSPGKESVDVATMLLAQTSQTDYEELCRLDVLGLEDRPINSQSVVYDEFKEQLTRDETGRYETGLPWRGNHPLLPNNRAGSLRRLASLTSRLDREGLRPKYNQILEEQKTEGIIESASNSSENREFYIPHKPVVRTCAESTKLRIVYDASARAHNTAPSLNECLHPGPSLTNKLWGVLVRSRFHPVALNGDLQKAFLQIRVREPDRDALRFHWQRDGQSDVEILRFARVPFGLAPSPFLLGGVIDMHLSTWEDREPDIVAKLREELYVDDLISGSTTVAETREFKEKITEMFKDGCFNLHKWHSNDRELESDYLSEEEPTYAKQQLGTSHGGGCKLLGLEWSKDSDTLHVVLPTEETVKTKRGILAKLSRIYDPLGFISPMSLRGKLIYRSTCDAKRAWDAPMPDNLIEEWNRWENDLRADVEVPRSLTAHREPIESIKLHSFGDASKNGVAACAYAVIKQASGTNQGLVAARARLPKLGLTIPRLELVAAHMAANLIVNIREALSGFPVESSHCWSDSTVVLHWIKGGGDYKQFVSNRVKKINDHQDLVWRHVPTIDNPADCASRAADAKDSDLWWHGPDWLKDPEHWPEDIVPQPSVESNAEAKLVKSIFAVAVNDGNEADQILKKFPMQKALRVCAWMRRFANNGLRKRGRSHLIGPLTTEEIDRQRLFYIKRAQENCDLEIDRVALNLKPGKDGLLECRGRMQGEYPIYIPDHHLLSQRIVEEAHQHTLHGGVGLTMAHIRTRYWIPRLRRLVKKVRRRCYGCKRLTATAYAAPPPGILPTTRTEGKNAYQVIGVDFAGPLQYRTANNREGKAYILLYACSLTRGIMIDLLPDLTTAEFLLSLKRFIARRGRPERIYSDNGGTFVAAEKWIRMVRNDERFQDYLGKQEIRWQFNLSRAPWWGGQFERIIGLVKSALRKCIGNGMLRWKELEEVLLDVEVTLNNRPLSYVEDDLQLPVLIPNCLLFANSNILHELEPHHIEEHDLRRRAKHLLKCKEAVWKRWHNEYLRSLRERHRTKKTKGGLTPTVGDVVIIGDNEKKRGEWQLGVVEELVTGKDGEVRVAKVRSRKSRLERAVQQLYPLELSCDVEQPTEPVMNPEAPVFRPKRDAAIAARQRIREVLTEKENDEH